MKPHKHAKLIKAWADGAVIEMKWDNDVWRVNENPYWYPEDEYRIKPEPKPDVVKYYHEGFIKYAMKELGRLKQEDDDVLKIVWDGYSGRFKSAEVLK